MSLRGDPGVDRAPALTIGTSSCTSLSAARRTDGVCAVAMIAMSVAAAIRNVLLELLDR